MFPKNTRTRLKGKALKLLFLEALKRDDFKCQICGDYTYQPPHHIFYGSHKEDVLDNLITLCFGPQTNDCHSKVHAHLLAIEPYLSVSQRAYMALKNKQNNVREVVNG